MGANVAAEGKELAKPPWAAVITPYTEQLSELRGRFEQWRCETQKALLLPQVHQFSLAKVSSKQHLVKTCSGGQG